jgi:Holliday junction resolvase-like predicted endonuclease
VNTRQEGLLGEEKAIKALKKRGYKILERNHTTRFGEIDVIAARKVDTSSLSR